MRSDFIDFCRNFDIVENALDMRTLVRWNGRNLVQKENLAEHTHLVVACAMDLCDMFDSQLNPFDKYGIVKACMLHDSVELLRGDILSITKDAFPEIRECIDSEEDSFMELTNEANMDEMCQAIVKLADLKACYKFLEREIQNVGNQFAKDAYWVTKKKYDDAFYDFCMNYDFEEYLPSQKVVSSRFEKGYNDDAGIDIVLDKNVVIPPLSTISLDLHVSITPKKGEMGMLCARTSAAAKGISVAMCPIDPNYSGSITAIIHNVSNNFVTYKSGESLCQYVSVPLAKNDIECNVKKPGVRTDSKLGGTDK